MNSKERGKADSRRRHAEGRAYCVLKGRKREHMEVTVHGRGLSREEERAELKIDENGRAADSHSLGADLKEEV